MLYLLFAIALCEPNISDESIRLPIYNPNEKEHPYQIVTCYDPDAQFIPVDEGIVNVEILSRDNASTVAKINVIYADLKPFETEIIVTNGTFNNSIEVEIAQIHHFTINSTVDHFYLGTDCRIFANAFDKNGSSFTSLNGTEIQWGSENSDESSFKYSFDSVPRDSAIIHPTKFTKINVTCKFPKRSAPAVYQSYQFVEPYIFEPNHVHMIKYASINISLYHGYVDENGEVKPKKDGLIELGNPENHIILISNSSVNVSEAGEVTAADFHNVTVVARDNSTNVDLATCYIYIQIPDRTEWKEQWIKSPELKNNETTGPFAPETESIKHYVQDIELILPKNFTPSLNSEWRYNGSRNVSANYNGINYRFQGLIHTCPRPSVNPSEVRIPFGYHNYTVNITGGSGFYEYEYDKKMLLLYENVQEKPEEKKGLAIANPFVTPLKEGTTVIKIKDKIFKDYETEITIHTEKAHAIDFSVNDTELFVEEKFANYTVNVYDKNNVKFNISLENIEIIPDNYSVFNSSGYGESAGFTHVYAKIDNLKSEKIEILVMDQLAIRSPIFSKTNTTINLSRTGGPIPWPGASQTTTITCDGEFENIDNYTLIKFPEDFEGVCALKVVNDKSDKDPNPRECTTWSFIITTTDKVEKEEDDDDNDEL